MEEVQFDVGLVNLTSDRSDGLATLARADVVASDIPIISLIAHSDEPQLLHLGTRDYLIKEQLNSLLLVRTLRHAIEQDELFTPNGTVLPPAPPLDSSAYRTHFQISV